MKSKLHTFRVNRNLHINAFDSHTHTSFSLTLTESIMIFGSNTTRIDGGIHSDHMFYISWPNQGVLKSYEICVDVSLACMNIQYRNRNATFHVLHAA